VSYSGGAAQSGAAAISSAAAGAGLGAPGPAPLPGLTGGGPVPREDLEAAGTPPPVQQRTVDHDQQIGRNDPCWCGSGKKFKKCHGA
jgi:preprotein translocase subunit SecA